MKMNEEFCGQKNGYSRSITLRNKLIPIGKTEENINQFLENDIERSMAYPEVKKLIDDIHRSFIQDTLSKVTFPWEPLFDEFELYQNEKDKLKKASHKKELEKLQTVARKRIVEAFKKNPDFDKLFKDGLFKELLPALIKNSTDKEITDKKEAVEVFNRFSTYFTGFHQNRQNMYSEDPKSTAISYRIVNENFPKFFANVKLFNYLQENFPQIIKDTETSLKLHLNGKTLSQIFNIEAFNDVLTQTGIDFYNTVIGGISGEAGSEKVQGLNEKINLAKQQLPKEEQNKLRGKMTVLYKQILSDRETSSFIPVGFENNNEVYDTVKQFNDETYSNVVEKIKELINICSDYDISQIFVPAKELTAFSLSIFGNWSILSEGLFLLEKDKSTKNLTEKQIEAINKEIEKKDYSLVELQTAYERWCTENTIPVTKTVRNFFAIKPLKNQKDSPDKTESDILQNIKSKYAIIDFENQHDLQQEKDAATPIKDYLDEVQELYHHLKLVDYRGEEQKDTNFYSKLDEVLQKLSEIVPLYNKVRNYVTKKPGEVKKVKLNFDCSSFLNGWGTEFGTKDTHLFIIDGKYYLGIIDKKLSKDEITGLQNTVNNSCKHIIYDFQKPDNKNTPRLFIRSKGESYAPAVSKYNLPIESIIDIYDKGMFKTEYRDKNPQEYRKALIQIIEYFKLGFSKHESYKNYDFCWKEADEYNDIAEFYSDVIKSCYKLDFENINYEKLLSLVDSGKLFLFQIYNKDFAEKSSGKKNLHTLYWENLFSEENLKDICLKLNGEAELFWRKASLDSEKVTHHKKGSILVNRTTKDGKSIPEEIYQEIYQYKNKMISSVSDETKKLLDSGTVVFKEATHEITKDKHFTEDTYLFHCPITMNFKAPEITGRKFNDKVLEYLSKNPDVKIIGLDRGERHLLYLSLINQKGEIEMQKTLNLVEQVRNDKTVSVNYQEKLVQKEGDRDKARKNWQTIGNIKELKEGYLSNIVHEIAKLMVENNAIVVMEDLNFGFKRGRFAVERQVYQKFENMLIEKLNYLVFKDKGVTEPGGVLNAYQLTDKSANVSDVYKQCGWLFYIPAAYTSKIDPKTGFSNLFITKGLTNVEKKKEFFDKFDSIRYDNKEDCFVFGFDYSKLCDNADYNKKWEVYTKGERLVYSKAERTNITVNPTAELKKVFEEFNINWKSEDNFIDSLQTIQAEKTNIKFFDTLLRSFNATLQMRNSIPNSEIDYLISPVKADDGTFFDSREQLALGKEAKLPIDADANGAYHIALKGLYLLQNDFNRNEKGVIQNISNADWFRFVQEKEYQK
ncbi:MAG: type V CRISPR-associated protein Cas12a/Cpf1 [Treponema sp.]|nr:type V CRISPR-associated protein Cas12a/Cpf1 [Candidatus Treponema merdequi]